ncbi:phosphate acyltransferase PlsX [Selenomonadales bacterium OttesenSCG-928-I06]|nr:phosphate acyltransferase PlsX [Selenomonadales bacterium OttesenSCG-928-I06]
MKVAIDAMGGDFAPQENVLGAIEALKEYKDKNLEIILVGNKDQILEFLPQDYSDTLNIKIHNTTEVIEMDDHPAAAVREKKDSSLVVAARLVKDGLCDSFVSAGSTGAAVAASLLILGRIKNIERATIATPIPNPAGTTLLLDSGANVDSKPKHLLQSAIMGSIYAEHILKISNPRIGLLNIGEEESKGNKQALETLPLLKNLDRNKFNFIGNVEGRDITNGSVDVVVCDGFVGNVVLKFGEGLAYTILQILREALETGSILTKIATFFLLPAMRSLKKKFDYAEFGGAPLLGVNGGCIICHGSSKAKAIKNAIRVAAEFKENDVLNNISKSIAAEEKKEI